MPMPDNWVDYRPQWQELAGMDEIKTHLHPYTAFDMPHLLLSSPQPGTGKTTFAYALADRLDVPIHLFNASSKRTRGIEFIEEDVAPLARCGREMVILLDEADQLTPAAQSALKGVIENAQGYFILTCNDLSKISEWLKSRCFVCNFKPISEEDMMERLSVIAGKEGVKVTSPQMRMIIEAHNGDLRNAIGALQVYASMNDEQAERFLLSLSGNGVPTQEFLYHAFTDSDFDYCLKILAPHSPRISVKEIFKFGMESKGQTNNKLKLLDAAVTAERDFLLGVDENIALANFVRMCIA